MSKSDDLIYLLIGSVTFLVTSWIMNLLSIDFLWLVGKFIVMWWIVVLIFCVGCISIVKTAEGLAGGLDDIMRHRFIRKQNKKLSEENSDLRMKIYKLENERDEHGLHRV